MVGYLLLLLSSLNNRIKSYSSSKVFINELVFISMKVIRLLFGSAILILSGCHNVENNFYPPPKACLYDEISFVSNKFAQVIDQKSSSKNSDIVVSVLSSNIKGDTTYRIDFSEGTSQLEFPLNNAMIGFGFSLMPARSTMSKNRDGFNLKWWISQNSKLFGNMKDSDWLTDAIDIAEVGQTHPGLDIYSESTAKLSARIIDVNYVYNIIPSGSIAVGAVFGYLYQNLRYNIYNVNQVGFGPYAANYTGNVSGKVLDYEITYSIPYLGLTTDMLLLEKVRFNFQWGYSVLVQAKDIDKHILRYKLSKGDTSGTANIISLNLEWEFQPQWLVQFNLANITINTDGKQNQYWYGNDPVTTGDDTGAFIKGISDKITSSQKIMGIGIRYNF